MSVSTNLHEVKSITLSKPTSLGTIADRLSYYRVIEVTTESGETFELTLFSPDLDALTIVVEH